MKPALLGLGAALLLAGCGTDPSPPPNGVAVTSDQFTPAVLTVPVSTAVTWDWQGGTHDVTFEDGVGNSERNKSGGTHNRTFQTAGSYRYRCTNHSTDFGSGMVGTITVQ